MFINSKHQYKLLLPLLILGLIAYILSTPNSSQQQTHTLTGKIFGTTYSVKINSTQSVNIEEIQNKIDQKLNQIDVLMSTWNQQSELSLLNQKKAIGKVEISYDLYKVLKESKRIYELSNHYFDITLEPLILAWGFSSKKVNDKVLSQTKIDELLNQFGSNYFELSQQNQSYFIDYKKPLKINLSAIAKGYAVDQISELLLGENYENHLAEIGGEIAIKGYKNSQKKLWKVAIQNPNEQQSNPKSMDSILMTNNSIATSGDYRNYKIINGKRYSHTINPKTGYPIEHNLASVSVLHPSNMTADALATAFMAMGFENARRIANKNNIASYFILRKNNNQFSIHSSEAFKKFLNN